MIFISPVSSVEEKPLLVKQLLFTVNGSKLSGIPTTLDINDPSVKPARWAPKYFESADDDKINIEVFSALITCCNAFEYDFDVKSGRVIL